MHLLLLFLLGRFSRANHNTSPSAPGTVHSLQVRRECSRLARASIILGSDQVSGPKIDYLELKEQLTAAKTQMLLLLLHNVGGLPYPRKLGR